MATGVATIDSEPSLGVQVRSTASVPSQNVPLMNGRWKVVVVNERNADGTVGTEESKWVLDTKTNEIYHGHDDPLMVKFKSLIICTILNPIYTGLMMGWNVTRIPVDITIIAVAKIKEAGAKFAEYKSGEAALVIIKLFVWHIPKAAVLDLWEVVRAPIYGLGVEITTAMAVISLDPFYWRSAESKIENSWQHGASYHDDCRLFFCQSEAASGMAEFIDRCSKTKAFYLAWCFQNHGKLADRTDFVVVREESVKWVTKDTAEHLCCCCPSSFA